MTIVIPEIVLVLVAVGLVAWIDSAKPDYDMYRILNLLEWLVHVATIGFIWFLLSYGK